MKESNLFPDLPRNDSNLDLENQSIDSSILLLSNILLHQYPVSNISYRDQERARKEILTQKKQLYRSEIFPRERMVSKGERRTSSSSFDYVFDFICKLSKAYCVLSSAGVVSNISGTISASTGSHVQGGV